MMSERRHDFDSEMKQGIDKNGDKPLEETDEENEVRPRSHIRRKQKKKNSKKNDRFPRII